MNYFWSLMCLGMNEHSILWHFEASNSTFWLQNSMDQWDCLCHNPRQAFGLLNHFYQARSNWKYCCWSECWQWALALSLKILAEFAILKESKASILSLSHFGLFEWQPGFSGGVIRTSFIFSWRFETEVKNKSFWISFEGFSRALKTLNCLNKFLDLDYHLVPDSKWKLACLPSEFDNPWYSHQSLSYFCSRQAT